MVTPAPATATAALPLRQGDAGPAVADLQRRLAAAGHGCGADEGGVYGPGTADAVHGFQARRGLRADGVCGEQTWSSIVEAGHLLGERLLYLRSPMLRGDDVADLQRRLDALGFDTGKVDGICGPRTAAAVSEFQRNVGLTTDAVCGPDTIEALRRVSGRIEADGPGSTVAGLREADRLWGGARPRSVSGLRVAVGGGVGIDALADALAKALADDGAVVTVARHLLEPERAAAANAFEAGLFVALGLADDPGLTCAYYATDGFESVGGKHLATLLGAALAAAGLRGADGDALPVVTRGMRLPVLRETRMPAVLVEVGPPEAGVAGAPVVVDAVRRSVAGWVQAPAAEAARP